jgi:hypothetical protein
MAAAPLATVVLPGALGDNVVRLAWLVAAPVLVAGASTRRAWVAVAAGAATAVWPVVNSVEQISRSADPSATAGFYRPLASELQHQIAAAGPAALGERVEVVPTRTHWETRYLSERFQLARGWDRQADVADNSVFYQEGGLTSRSYAEWLRQMAVGWVARPATPLDSAGTAEGALVDAAPAYLELVWHDRAWRLYRVVPAAPLATGARVVAVRASSVTLHFDRAGTASVALRWTSYLVAVRTADGSGPDASVAPRGQFISVAAPTAGDYELRSDFRFPSPR